MNSTVDFAGKTDAHSSLRDSCDQSVFQVKLTVEKKKKKRNYPWNSLVRQRRKCYIIKKYPGKPKGGQFQSLLYSVILQPVRIKKPGAPILGLAKSIYYFLVLKPFLRAYFLNSSASLQGSI